MEGRQNLYAFAFNKDAARAGYGIFPARKIMESRSSAKQDKTGLDQSELSGKQASAGKRLLFKRSAIFWRTTFHDIADMVRRFRKFQGFEGIVHEPPGASHKGLTLQVFFSARPFADNHQRSLQTPSVHDNFPAAFPQLTGFTALTGLQKALPGLRVFIKAQLLHLCPRLSCSSSNLRCIEQA